MSTEGSCELCGAPLDSGEADACPSCLMGLGFGDGGGRDPAAMPGGAAALEQLDKLPPDLEVLDFIGRGGMGVVYKAKQIELDRIVALKILSPELAEEAEFAVRFMREARMLAKLSHPNIVTVFNFGSVDGFCYLLMEYVPGESLADAILPPKLTVDQSLQLALKVCDALRCAHDKGVIHRDIKPENVLIDLDGEPKVMDFGLAKLVDGDPKALAITSPEQSLGTPYYMAPEQRTYPIQTDERTDVYAFGVTLYQMLTHELPTGRFPLPSEKAGVSTQVDEVI